MNVHFQIEDINRLIYVDTEGELEPNESYKIKKE